MKLAGCLLLLSGAFIVLSDLTLLPVSAPRFAFVLAGVLVELIGLAALTRAHLLDAAAQARLGADHIRGRHT